MGLKETCCNLKLPLHDTGHFKYHIPPPQGKIISSGICIPYIHFRLRAQAQIQVMVKVINRIQDVCSMK